MATKKSATNANTAATNIISLDPQDLPKVPLSLLDKIKIKMPSPQPVDEDSLILRFEELRHDKAEKASRIEGQSVEAGDEVLVDFIGFEDGVILPHFVREDLWIDDDAELFLPGLRTNLNGVRIGSTGDIEITLPEDYPDPPFRNKKVSLVVAVKASRVVALPDPEDPDFLKKLGMGSSIDEVMENLAEEIQQEQNEALQELARRQAALQLASKLKIKIAKNLIDAEIKTRWQSSEGQALERMGCPVEQQQTALEYWLIDKGVREEVGAVMRANFALASLIQSADLHVEKEAFNAYLEGFAEATNIDVKSMARDLAEDEQARSDLYRFLLERKAVDMILEEAKLLFED